MLTLVVGHLKKEKNNKLCQLTQGSFCKMYIPVATVFSRIEFGNNHGTKFIDGYDGADKVEVSNVFSVALNVTAAAGSYVDGPIAAFKLTSGGCLAYDTQ